MQRSLNKTGMGLLKVLNNKKFYLSHRSVGQSMGDRGHGSSMTPSTSSPSQMLPTDGQESLLGNFNGRSVVPHQFIKMMMMGSGSDSDASGQCNGWRERMFTIGSPLDTQDGKQTDAVMSSSSSSANDDNDGQDKSIRIMGKSDDYDWTPNRDREGRNEQETGFVGRTSSSSSDEDDEIEDGDEDHDDRDRREPQAESVTEQPNMEQRYEGVYWTGDGRRVDTRLDDEHIEGAYVTGDGKIVDRPYEPEMDPPQDTPTGNQKAPKSKN